MLVQYVCAVCVRLSTRILLHSLIGIWHISKCIRHIIFLESSSVPMIFKLWTLMLKNSTLKPLKMRLNYLYDWPNMIRNSWTNNHDKCYATDCIYACVHTSSCSPVFRSSPSSQITHFSIIIIFFAVKFFTRENLLDGVVLTSTRNIRIRDHLKCSPQNDLAYWRTLFILQMSKISAQHFPVDQTE